MNRGRYIVIEGPHGVGKSTQIHMLADRLKAAGYQVELFTEPHPDADLTTSLVSVLINDKRFPMTTRTEVLLYNAARSQSLEAIRKARDNGVICLCDRSFLTTLAIQYYGRGDVPDYQTINNIINFAIGDMQPDLTIVLDAPVQILRERTKDKPNNFDEAFFERVRAGYLWEANQRQYPVIFANNDREKIAEAIWQVINGKISSTSAAAHETAPPITSNITTPATPIQEVIEQKKDTLNPARKTETSRQEQVNDSNKKTQAAEQSRTPEVTFLQDASSLLARKLQQSRPAKYTEQGITRRHLDKKGVHGQHPYYTPPQLPDSLLATYRQTLDAAFDMCAEMTQKLTGYLRKHSSVPKEKRDAAWEDAMSKQAFDVTKLTLPVATTSQFSITASGQALASLISNLLADNLPEAKAAGQAALQDLQKTAGSLPRDIDLPNKISAAAENHIHTRKAVADFAEVNLPPTLGDLDDNVQLTDYWPRNELDLVPYILYEHSNTSLKDLKQTIASWTYDQKANALHAYIGRQRSDYLQPGRALEYAHYTWDIVCDYEVFCCLQRHHIAGSLEWQPLTPRYGFDIPAIIEEAGLADDFEACFDKSAELYSIMQAEGFGSEAQYATLLGHRVRLKLTHNAREAFDFCNFHVKTQEHPNCRQLITEILNQLSDTHPLLTDAMKLAPKNI